jgi:hypothetical protein
VLLFNVFWLSWSSERSAKPRDQLRGPRQNSQILSVSASSVCYYSLFLGLGGIQTFGEPRGPLTGTSPKLTDLVHSDQFSMLLFTVFGCRGRPNIWGCPGSDYGDLTKTRRFGPFLPVFYAIIHSFLVVVVVRTFGEARGPVTGTSPKLADFVRFSLNPH